MAKNFYEQWLETPNKLQDELEIGRHLEKSPSLEYPRRPANV
jgi:hypothetical protein